MIVALAMASADIRTSAGRPNMRTCPDAVTIKPATRTDGCDMSPRVHTAVAHTGTGANHRSDMAARSDAMLANTRAGASTEDMAARADTMLVDVHVSANAQHIDAKINGVGTRCEQRHQKDHGANSDGKLFHSGNTSCGLHANARWVWTFPETPFRLGEGSAKTNHCDAHCHRTFVCACHSVPRDLEADP